MDATIAIASLHIHPVKGCAAVDVDAIDFDGDGLIVGDRVAAIVDTASGAFISQRHVGALAQLRASYRPGPRSAVELAWPGLPTTNFEPPEHPTPRRVTVWDDTFDADDGGDAAARWLGDALRTDVRLVWLGRRSARTLDPFWAGRAGVATSFADLTPLLVANRASLETVNNRRNASGLAAIEMARFRPNVVLAGLQAFAEDAIETLRAADGTVLRFIKPCARCAVIELDPAAGAPTDDEVLRSLAPFRTMENRRGTRGVMFGQNVCIDRTVPGRLAVGDSFRPSWRATEIA